MASNINPQNIDGNFPIAGQDNDSQGFRDNFTNVKTNLSFAKFEIEDLQKNALLRSPLGAGSTVDNDIEYKQPITRAKLIAPAESAQDAGTVSGVASIGFLDGTFHKITLGGPLAISFEDSPVGTNGNPLYGKLRLWVKVEYTTHTLTLPVNCVYGLNTITGLNTETKAITYSQIGNYLYEFFTIDGGTEYWALQLA